MKYKELKERLKELDVDLEKYGKELCIGDLAVVYEDKQYEVYFLEDCEDLESKERVTFYDTVLEYAKTPLNERGLEYNVVAYRRMCGSPGDIEEKTYFYRRNWGGELSVADEDTNHNEDQRWTLEQIKEYDLDNCERMEFY